MTHPRLATSEVEESDLENGEKRHRSSELSNCLPPQESFIQQIPESFSGFHYYYRSFRSFRHDSLPFFSKPSTSVTPVLALLLSHDLCLFSLFPLTTWIQVTKYGRRIELYWEHHLFTYFIYLFILLFGCTLRHVGSSFPDQGLNLAPLALEV